MGRPSDGLPWTEGLQELKSHHPAEREAYSTTDACELSNNDTGLYLNGTRPACAGPCAQGQ